MVTILRLPEVKERTGLSRSTIYNLQNPNHKQYDPSFPKSFPLGARLVGWSSDSVDAWIKKTIQQEVTRR
ncbi:MAG: AlpA family phage regulatory protein [Gammaproteobacteria bacterium]